MSPTSWLFKVGFVAIWIITGHGGGLMKKDLFETDWGQSAALIDVRELCNAQAFLIIARPKPNTSV